MKTNLSRKEVMIMSLEFIVARLLVIARRLYLEDRISHEAYLALNGSLTQLVACS